MKPGIYDQLVTKRVRSELARLEESRLQSELSVLEESDAPTYLARHVTRQIKIALASLPVEERRARQIELANNLLKLANGNDADLSEESIDAAGEVLKAIYQPPAVPVVPIFPLSSSGLIINAKDEPRLGMELDKELRSADRVMMLVSFIQWRGWQRLRDAFEQLAVEGRTVRVLTTTYIGATDLRALQAMVALPNVELKVSLDGRRRRLHAKAWLFERDSGFSSAYVGSANVSGPALEDGIEWTVRLSEVETPHVLDKFRGAFESLWAEEEFERFDHGDEAFASRVASALSAAKGSSTSSLLPPLFFDLRPHPYQQATLDKLDVERLDLGHWRNLVVAPTGTGKTLLAAFDFKRQGKRGLRPKLLFLAHRRELLQQARSAFRYVLRDECFGELLSGGEYVSSYEHLFSTVQSFQSRGLIKEREPNYWDFVVVDEAHHVSADSYRDAIEILRPRILLGLTATPERFDGQSILPWFDGRIADEMRLWHAVERQYLVPFDYYGIHDGTDLSEVNWSRGGYAIAELDRVYNGNVRRAALVADQFRTIYGDFLQARALAFCVSVTHAEFMAKIFREAGIPAASVTSQSTEDVRSNAVRWLREREVNVLFTVDLFNEGVDIPEVDCLLFLRPTESPTVFIQQLGRGLRLDTGKTNCLVLDFIGNQRQEFRFDLRLRTLFGTSRKETVAQLESGVTALPGNCYFHLDKESQKLILASLKKRLSTSRVRMVQELRALADSSGRRPELHEFLAETQYELSDVYKGACSWSLLLAEAQLLDEIPDMADLQLTERFGRLLHINAVSRLRFYQDALNGLEKTDGSLLLRQRLAFMLTYRLAKAGVVDLHSEMEALEQIRTRKICRREFLELAHCLMEEIKTHEDELPYLADEPLYLHRRYTRDEILVACGAWTLDSRKPSREGRLWLPESNRELLFVTLDKNEKQFSPTTRYEDFAVSPSRFHWQSQSLTSETSPTGLRYIGQRQNGTDFLLFVRETRSDAYIYLGPLRYSSHTGSRPMSIYWNLDHPIPAWFFEICATLRAA